MQKIPNYDGKHAFGVITIGVRDVCDALFEKNGQCRLCNYVCKNYGTTTSYNAASHGMNTFTKHREEDVRKLLTDYLASKEDITYPADSVKIVKSSTSSSRAVLDSGSDDDSEDDEEVQAKRAIPTSRAQPRVKKPRVNRNDQKTIEEVVQTCIKAMSTPSKTVKGQALQILNDNVSMDMDLNKLTAMRDKLIGSENLCELLIACRNAAEIKHFIQKKLN